MRTVLARAAVVAGTAALTAGLSAQSLGDVAKRQADRQASTAGKKYTNEDLGPGPDALSAPSSTAVPKGAHPPSAAPLPSKDATTAAAAAGDGDAATAIPERVEKRDEKYWRNRAGTLNGRMADIRSRTTLAERRLKEMDDALANGAGTAHTQERKVALKALQDVKQEAGFIQEEVTRMEKRAQASNVPPEWLR